MRGIFIAVTAVMFTYQCADTTSTALGWGSTRRAIALRGDIFTQCLDALARDNLGSDRRLDRYIEHLAPR